MLITILGMRVCVCLLQRCELGRVQLAFCVFVCGLVWAVVQRGGWSFGGQAEFAPTTKASGHASRFQTPGALPGNGAGWAIRFQQTCLPGPATTHRGTGNVTRPDCFKQLNKPTWQKLKLNVPNVIVLQQRAPVLSPWCDQFVWTVASSLPNLVLRTEPMYHHKSCTNKRNANSNTKITMQTLDGDALSMTENNLRDGFAFSMTENNWPRAALAGCDPGRR